MSNRSEKLAVAGVAGACVACCAAPIGAGAAAIAGALGVATAVVYPLVGVIVIALGTAVIWRLRRRRRVHDLQPGTAGVAAPVVPTRPGEQASRRAATEMDATVEQP